MSALRCWSGHYLDLQPTDAFDFIIVPSSNFWQRKSLIDGLSTACHARRFAFWQEVADDPEALFSDERSGNTIWNLWKVMSRQGEESRASGWNRRFMEGHFGKDNACYTVDQEAVTADEKETDIRLRSTIPSQQATIELKVGERDWSASVLRDKLRTQLVDQYMAAEDCRAGCMLITVATNRHWQHPETNKQMTFDELITFLCEEAEKIVQEFGGSIRLMVKGLDLRPRLKKLVSC